MKLEQKIVFLLIFSGQSFFSQDIKDDRGIPWKFGYSPQHVPYGIAYQNEFLFQIGQRIGFRKKRELFSICGLIQLQKRTVTYVSPVLLISYFKPIKKL